MIDPVLAIRDIAVTRWFWALASRRQPGVGWGRHCTIHIFVIGVKFTIFKCTIQCH